jgi:predicted RNA binding protein YcfA (HicA-like mRNA interferase family)
MSKVPRASGQEVVAALTRTGFRVRRQHGSHIILRRDEPFAQTVVPNHREIVPEAFPYRCERVNEAFFVRSALL